MITIGFGGLAFAGCVTQTARATKAGAAAIAG
jgi:hypothetical protein